MFTGGKFLYKKKDIDYIHVSHYEELSVKNLWVELKGDATFKKYFSDEYPADRKPNRDYFFNVLNTLYPIYLSNIMSHAAKQRFTTEGEKMKAEKIEITEEWLNELSRMPFVSRKFCFNLWLTLFLYIEKRGKTLHLLKAKSKKINPNKRRKKIPLLGSIKDYHNAAQNLNVPHQSQENMNASDGNFTMVNKGDIEIENSE